jgi:hypothetical protein
MGFNIPVAAGFVKQSPVGDANESGSQGMFAAK